MQIKRTISGLNSYMEFKCKKYKTNKCNKSVILKNYNNSDFFHFIEKNNHLTTCFNLSNNFKKEKNKVINLINSNVFKLSIIYNILNKENNFLDKTQIKNIVAYHKKSSFKSDNFDENYLNDFINNFLNPINTKFNNNIIIYKEFNNNSDCKFLITSEILIKSHAKYNVLHVDTTYKLLHCNYPVIVMGVSDFNKNFHLLMIGITKSETDIDFLFFIINFKKICLNFKIIFEPSILVSDCAPAILNAFLNIFPNIKIINCWAHRSRNLKQKFKIITNNDLKKLYYKDFKLLQLSYNSSLFKITSKLFLDKWYNFFGFKSINDYVSKSFFNKFCNWYEGFSNFTPSTNNCLEAFNNIIKRDYLFYNKKYFLEIIPILSEIINNYSNKYINFNYKFSENIIYTEEKILNLKFEKIFEDNNYIYFYEDNNNKLKIIEILKNNFNSLKNFNDFDLFLKNIIIFYNKHYPVNQYNLFCTCCYFLKNYKCSHLLT